MSYSCCDSDSLISCASHRCDCLYFILLCIVLFCFVLFCSARSSISSRRWNPLYHWRDNISIHICSWFSVSNFRLPTRINDLVHIAYLNGKKNNTSHCALKTASGTKWILERERKKRIKYIALNGDTYFKNTLLCHCSIHSHMSMCFWGQQKNWARAMLPIHQIKCVTLGVCVCVHKTFSI